MAEYSINKGIGRSPEFKGLKSMYLFVFAGGLLAVFVIFVVMYMAGVGQWTCIAFGVLSASLLVWGTFHLNARFGEYGLMKLQARGSHPRYIITGGLSSGCFPVTITHEAYEKCNESSHAGKQVSDSGGGTRLHHQQGRGYYGSL